MKPSIPYLLHSYLRNLGIRIDSLRIRDLYVRYPLPHSIRSLSDTLDELNIGNMVCALTFEQLFEIDGAFIVVVGKDEYPFFIVERLDRERKIVSLHSATGKRFSLTFDQFQMGWDGTVLMAEKTEDTKEDGRFMYQIKQGLWFIDRTEGYWLSALMIYILFWGAMQAPEISSLRYFIKIVGVVISLVVVIKASLNSRLAQRFCRYGKRADCNEVFQSVGAMIFGWISLGELSLAYFSASLFWGIFMAVNPAAVFPLLDALGILLVIYSLGWQFYYKKWCSLCLLIDLVLVVDFVTEILLWNNFQNMLNIEFYPDFINFGLLFTLCLLGVKSIITMAKKNIDIHNLKYKNERLLSSVETFWMLLRNQPEEPINSNDIPAICNYKEAEHTITVVMNPSCPKCAAVHEMISSLNDYRVNLVFVVNNGDERSHNAALVMITSGMKYNWDVTDNVIKNWYSQQVLPEFLEPHYHAEDDLKAQMDYCRNIHLEGTPTILIDNRRLPEMYDVEDLKMLL